MEAGEEGELYAPHFPGFYRREAEGGMDDGWKDGGALPAAPCTRSVHLLFKSPVWHLLPCLSLYMSL